MDPSAARGLGVYGVVDSVGGRLSMFLIPLVVLSIASFVQGSMGFGFGMVCMSTLPLVLSHLEVVPLVGILGLALNIGLLVQLRDSVSWTKVSPLLAGALVGIPIGVMFLRSAPRELFEILLGSIIVIWVVRDATRRELAEGEAEPRPRWGVVAGAVGGMLGGAFNTAGPPVLMYVGRQPWTPATTKATLQLFFAGGAILQISLMSWSGLVTENVLRSAALGLPAVWGGMWLGSRLSADLDRERYGRWLRWGLFVLGVAFLLRPLKAWFAG